MKLKQVLGSDIKIQILFELKVKDNYISIISRNHGSTYSHAVKVTRCLVNEGLIKSSPKQLDKRRHFFTLTEKGHRVVDILYDLNKELN